MSVLDLSCFSALSAFSLSVGWKAAALLNKAWPWRGERTCTLKSRCWCKVRDARLPSLSNLSALTWSHWCAAHTHTHTHTHTRSHAHTHTESPRCVGSGWAVLYVWNAVSVLWSEGRAGYVLWRSKRQNTKRWEGGMEPEGALLCL